MDYDQNQDLLNKRSGVQYESHNPWYAGEHIDPNLDRFNTERYNINTQGFNIANQNFMGTNAPSLNTLQSDQARAQQMALANALQGQAYGTAPSIAQAQLQAGTDANIAQQMAMAQSGRGNPALAQRLAMQNAAGAQQTMAQQATLARLQEQQQAQQNLANLLSGTRSQDLTGATANLGAQTNVLTTGMGLDAATQQANQRAALQREALRLQEVQGANQTELGVFNTLSGVGQQSGGGAGGFLSGLGGLAAGLGAIFSDEDLKENITEPKKKLGEFLSNVGAHEYEYKDKKMGKGKFVSPMAQELEKSELGEGMVEETPQGKAVNYGRGLGLILASQGYLNDRLDELESALKKRGKKNA
jgi:hypothetical protein